MHSLLPFLPSYASHPAVDSAPALYDDHSAAWVSYGELRAAIRACAAALQPEKRSLVLCCPPRSVAGATAYLAAAQAGHAILLADPDAPNLQALAKAYEPEWALVPEGRLPEGFAPVSTPLEGLTLGRRTHTATPAPLHPDLYLILLTSGSTGSGKGVRLSYRNMASNALAIVESLNLTAQETALAHLPLAYSFGLSVLHMQLTVGGRCALSEESLLSGGLWALARRAEATLFAGVPYHYEMLARLGLARLNAPKLTCFLQAGGRMQRPLTETMLAQIRARAGRLFIMYGQTEASPRLSCFALHERPEKIGSSGKALAGGRFEIREGEIHYSGPNVMMGYAETRADLAKGDEQGGQLATGDLGFLDEEGFLTITGRKQRFAKLFGQRIALDDLESLAAPLLRIAAFEGPESVILLCTQPDPALHETLIQTLAERTGLPQPWFELRVIEAFPHKPNGKMDYKRMQAMLEKPHDSNA